MITLEKVLDGSIFGPLPLCAGGRGLAPTDDSGGVWGWAEKVKAANDPEHPEHEEIRQCLGLAPGYVLDPKEFDKEDVNIDFRVRD